MTDVPIHFTIPEVLLDELEQRVTVRLREELGNGSPWFTVRRAAEYLGKSEMAVRGLIKRREIPAYRPNGSVFLAREDIDAWVRQAS